MWVQSMFQHHMEQVSSARQLQITLNNSNKTGKKTKTQVKSFTSTLKGTQSIFKSDVSSCSMHSSMNVSHEIRNVTAVLEICATYTYTEEVWVEGKEGAMFSSQVSFTTEENHQGSEKNNDSHRNKRTDGGNDESYIYTVKVSNEKISSVWGKIFFFLQ